MGVVQSIFCSVTFCVERVLTWTCCAFLLMMLMFLLVVLMIYGISVGYHYAQKELASFAMSSRSTTEMAEFDEAGGGGRRSGPDMRPIVRLVAVNRTETEHAPQPLLGSTTSEARRSVSLLVNTTHKPSERSERAAAAAGECQNQIGPHSLAYSYSWVDLEVYRTNKPKEHVYLHASETPIILLETERPPRQPELSPNEKELAKKLIGRFRRSRNTTDEPFLRPLGVRNSTNITRFAFS